MAPSFCFDDKHEHTFVFSMWFEFRACGCKF